MALYGIGDLHLSLGADKPMDIFGPVWRDHLEKLREGFAALGPEDVCVILGDLSWSMGLEASAPDFRFLDSLGGRKLILKGNHDYWWSTAAKVQRFFEKEDIRSVGILHNNCWFYGDIASAAPGAGSSRKRRVSPTTGRSSTGRLCVWRPP